MQSWEYFHNRFEPVEETNCLLFESHLRKQVGFFCWWVQIAFKNQLDYVPDTTLIQWLMTTHGRKCIFET